MAVQQPTEKERHCRGVTMGVGVGIGIAIGAAVGAAMRKEAMGVALGTAFGVVSRRSFDIQERQERLTRQP